jgi:hypothetical protein
LVSKISFIQAKLQYCIAAFVILSRMVVDRGIDLALKQEPWNGDGSIYL